MSRRPIERLDELRRGAAPEETLAFFDGLPAASVDEILGEWVGSGCPTGHPLDGLLEASGWRGKRFDSPEDAHPLLFADARGVFAVNPAGLPMGRLAALAPLVRRPRVGALVRRGLRLRATRRPAARLRMMEFRGVVTATMIYDALPINDHLRAVVDGVLLGAMDLRGLDAPFFFVLRRER